MVGVHTRGPRLRPGNALAIATAGHSIGCRPSSRNRLPRTKNLDGKNNSVPLARDGILLEDVRPMHRPHCHHPRIAAARRFLFVFFSVVSALSLPVQAMAEGGIWLAVDTTQLELRVMRGNEVLESYSDIAIGRFGVTQDKRHLDGKTQLGTFRINRINNESPFRRFYGFDYPKLDQAERALQAGDLTAEDFHRIRNAHRRHSAPPQNTRLGGFLGIHGIGAGDPQVHASYNWTNGCIALTNEQIDALSQWVKLGTRVVIY